MWLAELYMVSWPLRGYLDIMVLAGRDGVSWTLWG